MKKLIIVFLIFALSFTVSACDTTEEEPPINGDDTFNLEEHIDSLKSTIRDDISLDGLGEAESDFIESERQEILSNLDDASSEEGANAVFNEGESYLLDLVLLAKGEADTFDLCELNPPFEACRPQFENLPDNDVLNVDRGFSGNLTNHFNVTAKDFEGNNITSLIIIHGDLAFGEPNTYAIQFEVMDEIGNLNTSKEYTLNIERLDEAPSIYVEEDSQVLNLSTAATFDPMDGISAVDSIGLNLTSDVAFNVYNGQGDEVTFSGTPGYYRFVYDVIDVEGNQSSAEKEITIMPESTTTDSGLLEVERVQPGIKYFNANTVLDWEPEDDDRFNNIGTIPLQERINGEGVNPNADENIRVAILDQITDLTGGQRSFESFDQYTIEYFQYLDVGVTWGGSGNIVSPTQEVINLFHKNGVKILGNIFMRPTVYGGQMSHTYDLVQTNDQGDYIVGDTLIDIAEYYGFDGWFINLETDGGDPDLAIEFNRLGKYMQDVIDERGLDMEIQWYDSMIETGRIRWQGTLNENNEMFFQDGDESVYNSMFLDFRWDGRYGQSNTEIIKEARQKAIDLGRSPYDLFTGFDTQQYGMEKSSHTDTPWQWDRYFDENNNAYTSIGFYMSSWNFFQDNRGRDAKTYEAFEKNANQFFTGPAGDPRYSEVDIENDPNGWYGLSSFVLEKTVIQGDNFHSYFNTGNGHQFYKNGEVVSNFIDGYNNLNIQDVLPQWRWISDSLGADAPLDIGFDFDSAYYGGSNLLISGDLSETNTSEFKVYKTYLDIYNDTVLDHTFKTTHSDAFVEVVLTFESGGSWYQNETYLQVDITEENAWQTLSLDLSEFEGDKLTSIGYRVAHDDADDFALNIGALHLHRNDFETSLDSLENLEIIDQTFQHAITSDARITWDKLNDDPFTLYEIYQLNHKGEYQYLNAMYHNYAYIKDIARTLDDGELAESSSIVVKAFDNNRNQIAEEVIDFDWPEPIEGGRARFTTDSTLIAEGETVTFTPIESPVTDEYIWNFHDVDESNIEYLDNDSVRVTYPYQGTYTVELTTKNAYGEDHIKSENLIVVSNAASQVSNITPNARIHDFSGYNRPDEHPRYLIDGDRYSTKWCETTATTPGDKWVTIDLMDVYVLSQFEIYHAGVSEQLGYNTIDFQLQISMNGEDFETVVDIEGNTESITEHSISPTEARYVRLYISNAGSDNHSRVYELIVFGRLS